MNLVTTIGLISLLLLGSPISKAVDSSVHQTTVCELKERPSTYSHMMVTLRAHYTSDRRHFSLLTDSACSDQGNSIRVGTNNSTSADRLWKKWTSECDARGDSALCVVDEPVCVVGQMRDGGNQGWLFDIVSIELQENGGRTVPSG